MRYFRVQPLGAKLRGHTSEASDSTLPRGFVFAWRVTGRANDVILPMEWRHYGAGVEVVVFEGHDEYDPGDAEGVAVRPGRVVARYSCVAWLKKGLRMGDLDSVTEEKIREEIDGLGER